jgi:hypothetical protein
MTEPMPPEQLETLLIGATLLVLAVLAWTGVWKGWERIPRFRPFPITLGPMLGLGFVLGGLGPFMSRDMIGISGSLFFLFAIFSFYCFLRDPQWFRPKWYKGWDDRDISPTFWGYADLARQPAPPDLNSELAARLAHPSEELLARRGMCRLVGEEWGRPTKQHMNGVVEGAFLFYPSALVFCAGPGDDNLRLGPTVREIPASAICGVELTSPDAADRARGRRVRFGQVLVHTVSGPPWRVEVLRRERFMAEVRRFYLTPSAGGAGQDVEPGRER